MGAFFKGWRRKAGCFSLVMALGLATHWFRTLNDPNSADFTIGSRAHAIGSFRSGVYWLSYDKSRFLGKLEPNSTKDEILDYFQGDRPLSRILEQWCVDDLGDAKPAYWYVLYPWLVLPLTLSAAILLPGKPHAPPSCLKGPACKCQDQPS